MVRLNFQSRNRNADKPAGVGGKLGLSLFFLIFFAMGSFFEVLMIREFGRALAQRSWKKTPCKVVRSDVQERQNSDDPYAFVVAYEYEHGGQMRTATSYKTGYSGSDKYSDAQAIAQKYPQGAGTHCYVNPKNPAEVVLKRQSLFIGLVLLFPLIFVVIGAGGIYYIWRKSPPPEARPIAAEATRGGAKNKYVAAAFFAIFGIVGLAIFYPLGIRPISKTIAAKSWVTTPCHVIRAEVRSHDSDDGTTYSVHILYRYEFNGQRYKSDRYDFIGGSSSGYRGKARLAAQYEAMPNRTCFVNPDNPSEAVLKRGLHAKLLLALFPLPFILVGVFGVYYTLRGKGLNASRRKAWMPRTPRETYDDLAVLRQADAESETGPVVLKPKHSPRVKLYGAIAIALFWNGIVSIFVVQAIGGIRQGGANWFSALFMLPFIAVGIGLLGLVVYQFMALFNPRPTLELSSASVPLGGAAELSWSFTGRTDRLREFTVALSGKESATYRRGTNTYTAHNRFYEMELFKTLNIAEVTTGQIGFVLPADTMHSFEAENNKIVWNLEIRGDIPKWPDVRESFPITVVPALA